MIAQELKNLRSSLNLNQEEFGKAIGFSQRTISAWESGTNMPSIDALELIHIKWNISPNTLIYGSNQLNTIFDKLLEISKTEKNEDELIKYLYNYVYIKQESKIKLLINSLKGDTLLQKLSDSWNGNSQKTIFVLYYFIEYIEKEKINNINKELLIKLLDQFTIPTKILIKHLFTLNKENIENLKIWIDKHFNDKDAEKFIKNLTTNKDIIKKELNFLNKIFV